MLYHIITYYVTCVMLYHIIWFMASCTTLSGPEAADELRQGLGQPPRSGRSRSDPTRKEYIII